MVSKDRGKTYENKKWRWRTGTLIKNTEKRKKNIFKQLGQKLRKKQNKF